MKKLFLIIVLFLLFIVNNIHAEFLYLSARSTFSNAQFWEEQYKKSPIMYRNVLTNTFSGSVGLNLDFIVWDVGKKRGSRIFFKNGIDFVMTGVNYIGAYNVASNKYSDDDVQTGDAPGVMYTLNDQGAFYMGLSWDVYFGGTFPKTDLIWGIGCIFNFSFPVSYNGGSTVNFVEKFAFYAVPSLLLGYDIFLFENKLKITPQFRFGFTCSSFIPSDMLKDTVYTERDYIVSKEYVNDKYITNTEYSGLYIDFSISISFYSKQWKK